MSASSTLAKHVNAMATGIFDRLRSVTIIIMRDNTIFIRVINRDVTSV